MPRLADGTLVPLTKLKWPKLPGVQSPTIVQGPRYDGHDLPFLVPQVDVDGNELAGIRTAEQRVPVATYTGWNFRNAAIGGTSQLVNLLGMARPTRPHARRSAMTFRIRGSRSTNGILPARPMWRRPPRWVR